MVSVMSCQDTSSQRKLGSLVKRAFLENLVLSIPPNKTVDESDSSII